MSIRTIRETECDRCHRRERFSTPTDRTRAGWVEKVVRGRFEHYCPICVNPQPELALGVSS